MIRCASVRAIIKLCAVLIPETVKMKGREYKGYVYISEEGIKTKKDLAYWISLALDFNKLAKSSKKKK